MANSDFLIIGAGINGLLLARELTRAGAGVTVVDRGRCGREASWAGGGIVSPLYPWRYGPAVTALAAWAQAFYPRLAAELLEETGIDPELSRHGLLMLDPEDPEPALAWAQANKQSVVRLAPEVFYSRFSRLAPGFDSALWMERVCSVRNPRLLQALVRTLETRAGAILVENCRVVRFQAQANRIAGVEAEQGGRVLRLSAPRVIVSTGAWSGELLRDLGVPIEVYPVKGQMLLFQARRTLIDTVLLSRGRYLIPRRDGLILAGSTLEHEGFDKRITRTARAGLRAAALHLLPALKEARLLAQWAGLRPGAPGGIPYIGKIAQFDNLFINAGHYRNGLVLAPASARLLADLLLGRKPILDPSPYAPHDRVVRGGVGMDGTVVKQN